MPLIVALFLVGLSLALSNLHFINLAVKYYDATDVVPVLNAALLIAEIICGLVVGGELFLYDARQLFFIFICSLICIAGIQVLMMKTSQLTIDKCQTIESNNLLLTENEPLLSEN